MSPLLWYSSPTSDFVYRIKQAGRCQFRMLTPLQMGWKIHHENTFVCLMAWSMAWKRIPRIMCTLWNSFIAFLWWNMSELPRRNVISNKQKKQCYQPIQPFKYDISHSKFTLHFSRRDWLKCFSFDLSLNACSKKLW